MTREAMGVCILGGGVGEKAAKRKKRRYASLLDFIIVLCGDAAGRRFSTPAPTKPVCVCYFV